MVEAITRPTQIEISQQALKNNVAVVKQTSGADKIFLAVKSNAYGLGQTNFIVQRILQKNPAVDAAQVTVNGQHVTIKVIEKVTAGYVYQNGQWLVMDRNGRQQKVAAPKGDAPVYAGFKSQSELQQVDLTSKYQSNYAVT